jgi:hypothetical protein
MKREGELLPKEMAEKRKTMWETLKEIVEESEYLGGIRNRHGDI